jgi:hypothetical protein
MADNFDGMTLRDEARARDQRCFEKARAAGEITFTVREQDASAPLTIMRWIELNFHTAPRAKLLEAFESALNMRDSALPKKAAD